MSGGKETPRQKMIGMMYLVLTALLALNISADAIKAFDIVRKGLEETTSNFNKKNEFVYEAFGNALANNESKTRPYYEKAMLAKKYSGDLYNYIDSLKSVMIEVGGGYMDSSADAAVVSASNIDLSAELMITKGEGPKLKDKINETRALLYTLIPEEDRASVNLKIEAVDPPAGEDGLITWEAYLFAGKPLTAAITLMAKLQNDVRNAEADVIGYLLKAIDANDFKFDVLEPAVIASSNYVFVGQEFTADVFISASSSTQNPEIVAGMVDANGKLIGAGATVKVDSGIGKFKFTPSREGEIRWGGIIKVQGPSGEVKEYPFKSSFLAAKSTVVVSADKMNVLYIGVDNPMSISVPGVANENVSATLDGGSLRNLGNGKYIAQVTKAGETNVRVTATLPSGDKKNLGSTLYRVKRVPDPIATFAGKASGSITGGLAKVQRGVFAELPNFDFDLKFDVTRYRFIMSKPRRDPVILSGNSNALTPQMLDQTKDAAPGDRIFFDEIFVKGPDGQERKLESGILIEIK